MKYYNSIQDGKCCKACFVKLVVHAKGTGELLAVSEEFRFGAEQVVGRYKDHLDGIQDPFDISENYVDRAILKVTDEEVIIIANDADPSECLGWGKAGDGNHEQ